MYRNGTPVVVLCLLFIYKENNDVIKTWAAQGDLIELCGVF